MIRVIWLRLSISLTAATLLFSAPSLSSAQADSSTSGVFTLEEATVANIHAAFDSGGLTCQALVKLYLNRIAAYEDGGPRLNTITTVNSRVLSAAAALDHDRRRFGRRGPLHCIPVLLKDNIDVASMPTTNGSVILKDAVPREDAHITKALRAAGALILGKASMAEFAGANGYNSIDGQIVNPYNFKRNTGGSSSGSGAAVAANLTVLAIGTDTSTSIRGPASFNGIVGLRPTTGLISRDGIAPKNLNFDTAGPMGRTVTDVARLLTVIAGPDAKDAASVDVYNNYPSTLKVGPGQAYGDFSQFLKKGSLRGVHLGVVRDFFGGDPEVDALAEAALATMKELGAILQEIRLDPAFLDFYVRNGAQNIRRIADYRFKKDWETYLLRFGPRVPKTVTDFVDMYETKVATSAFPAESSVLDLLHRSLNTSSDDPAYENLIKNVLPTATKLKLAIFETNRVEALVFPYQPTFASPINNPVRHVEDPTYVAAPGRPDPATLAAYSSVGFPAIVVPMGFGSHGLPMTISLMARPYDESRLLGYAYDYEQATMRRRPSALVPPLPGEVVTYQHSRMGR